MTISEINTVLKKYKYLKEKYNRLKIKYGEVRKKIKEKLFIDGGGFSCWTRLFIGMI